MSVRLVVDIGNSRAKWGLVRAGTIIMTGGAETAALGTPEQWASVLDSVARPDEVAIGCVGAVAAKQALQAWLSEAWRITPRELVSSQNAAGVASGYRTPAALGIDRWAAIAAGRARTAGALCVVDAGTACTVDVVDPAGLHQGGWIVPGLQLQAASLRSGTQGVRPEPVVPGLTWGSDTATAVANGSLAALVGLVGLACRRADQRWGTSSCILTGGSADMLARHLSVAPLLVPDLVLEGLDLLASLEGDIR